MWNKIKSWYMNIMLKVVSIIMQHLVSIKETLPTVKSITFAPSPITPDVVWPESPHDPNDLLLDQDILALLQMPNPYLDEYKNARTALFANTDKLLKLQNVELVRDTIDRLLDEGKRKQAFRLDALMHKAMTFGKDAEVIDITKSTKKKRAK